MEVCRVFDWELTMKSENDKIIFVLFDKEV